MEEGVSVSAAYEQAIKIREKVRDFERHFFETHGLEIIFANDGINRIIQQAIKENRPPGDICKSSVRNYESGLKLIKEKTGKTGFTIHKQSTLNNNEAASRQYIPFLIAGAASTLNRAR